MLSGSRTRLFRSRMSSGQHVGLSVTTLNPTDQVDLDFSAYVAAREQQLSRHLLSGVPDYGFSLDHQLRRRMAAMGPMRALAEAYAAAAVPLQKQLYQIKGIAIGPRQYPELYAMAEACASAWASEFRSCSYIRTPNATRSRSPRPTWHRS
jgi:hypothetical protein